MSKELQERLFRLEESFEFQDATIDDLNQVIIDQQKQIDKLELDIEKLKSQLATMATDGAENTPEPPPPHY